jgi:hypothetical protein
MDPHLHNIEPLPSDLAPLSPERSVLDPTLICWTQLLRVTDNEAEAPSPLPPSPSNSSGEKSSM